MTRIDVGDKAPDFTLAGTGGSTHTLSDHRGRWVVLAFYPGDATTVDVIALMAEGKRRVRERFGVELEAEVQFLGEVDASQLWSTS